MNRPHASKNFKRSPTHKGKQSIDKRQSKGSPVITIQLKKSNNQLKKSNKKTAAKNCQRPKTRTATTVRKQFKAE